MALFSGLTCPHELTGIAGLSCYLPCAEALLDAQALTNTRVPTLCMHGSLDEVVPVQLGMQAVEHLQELGQPVGWREYAMHHTLCPQQISDIGAWLDQVFSEVV